MAVAAALGQPRFLDRCVAITGACAEALRHERGILLAGSGDGGGDAQHIAGAFVSGLDFDRPPPAAIAITT